MNLILDANIIYSEGYASSNLFKFLISLARLFGHKLYVPAVVIDEVTAKLDGEIKEQQKNTNDMFRKWGRYLDRSLESPLNDLNPREEARLLRSKLEECGQVLEYPDTPHEELVKRAINRIRPFDKKGSGYRDSLIWESAVQLAATVQDQVVLLASDTIFKDGEVNLAKELKADLVERGFEDDKVVLACSLKEFVDNYIRPYLEGDPTGIFDQLDIDLHEAIALWVQEEHIGKEWDREELGLPWEYETLHLSMVEGVSDLKGLETKQVSNGEYLVRIEATLDCEFDAFVHKANVYGLDAFAISDFDWNRHYTLGSTSCQLRCELDIQVNVPGGEAPEISFLSMELIEP